MPAAGLPVRARYTGNVVDVEVEGVVVVVGGGGSVGGGTVAGGDVGGVVRGGDVRRGAAGRVTLVRRAVVVVTGAVVVVVDSVVVVVVDSVVVVVDSVVEVASTRTAVRLGRWPPPNGQPASRIPKTAPQATTSSRLDLGRIPRTYARAGCGARNPGRARARRTPLYPRQPGCAFLHFLARHRSPPSLKGERAGGCEEAPHGSSQGLVQRFRRCGGSFGRDHDGNGA